MSAEPPCNPHPDAPHGFDRNGSHNADRYVCDCEGWTPPDETAVCSNHYCRHAPLTHSLPGGACTQRRCGCSGYSTDPPKPGRYAPPPSAPAVQFVIPTEMTHIDPTTGRRRLGKGHA